MEKETVSRALRYVDDQGTVREVEITVRKDVDTRFAVEVPMYFDEDGEPHKIIGMLTSRNKALQRIDLTKYAFDDGKPVSPKGGHVYERS